MANRLQELLQQRALIKEHLAWLENEIAAASGQPGAEPSDREIAASSAHSITSRPMPRVAAPIISAVLPSRGPDLPRIPDDADALIAQLAAEEQSTPLPTKKGCWTTFSILLIFGVIGTWAFLYFFYRG